MFVHYRTRALVLKEESRGETDGFFTFYAQDFGKLEVLGKSIRKIDSKLRPGAVVLCLSEIEFVQGKGRKTLTDAILIEKFKNIGSDLLKMGIAYKISEVLNNLVRGQEPDGKIWQLLVETFQKLNNCGQAEIIYYYFFWKLAAISGYGPELYHCAICQKKLTPRILGFDSKENGIVCQDCFKKSEFIRQISPETVKILRLIAGDSFKTLIKLKIDPQYLKELKFISEKYYTVLCVNPSSF